MPNTKKSIQIKDSYKIWRPFAMKQLIIKACCVKYDSIFFVDVLNRSYVSMYVEWWLHNIGYYITKPFSFIPNIKIINLRCKDVDLEEK